MQLDTGTKLDNRYVIRGLIGEGGMANVYLADDIILNREVAVKILHGNLAKQERFVERFRREAEAVASLIHPNIVEIYDVGEYEGSHFIVMELLKGKTLKEIIQQKHFLSVSETIAIMQQICDGVYVAHQHGIIHRDLKPQNISIADDHTVKIMDFGIAYQQEATPLTQTNAVMGSVHYLSPEQAKGEYATFQTDIYSLGIVMYEMLVGTVPFSGESAVNIVLQHLREPIPYVSEKNIHIPQSVENIVLRATAKNPDDRYQDLMDMRQDLDTCLDVDRMNEPREFYQIPDKTAEEEVIEQSQFSEDSHGNIEETSTKFVWTKQRKMYAATGIIGAIILAVVLFFALNGANEVEIPDLAGKPLDVAQQEIIDRELEVGSITEEASDEFKKGFVIKTEKAPLTKVKKRSKVNLVVSKGKMVEMPNLVGMNEADAIAKLEELGIKYEVTPEATKNTEDDGKVLKQGTKDKTEIFIEDDVIVKLTVGKVSNVVLREFAGMEYSAVEAFAKSNGLEVVKASEEFSEYAKGVVVRSANTWDGQEVPPGFVIEVIVSKGPEPVKPVEPEPTKPNEEDGEKPKPNPGE